MNYREFLTVARHRLDSRENYLKFQKFQAEWVITKSLKKYDLTAKTILDLGSGFGGYSEELSRFSDQVCAIDLNISRQSCRGNFHRVSGDAGHLPIKSESMDIIFCSSLIEHVADQEEMIAEIHRILKKKGICYLSFPPFYSPVGGHQFKPFHLLGEKAAIRLSEKFLGLTAPDYKSSFGNWGLYPTTIKKIRNLIVAGNLRILEISTRFSPINVARIPLLNEFLTWHVEFIIQKEASP